MSRLTRLLTGLLLAACAAAPAQAQADPWLLGRWAAEAGCARPWFSFTPAAATLQTQADGAPVQFSFAAVHYTSEEGGRIRVDFGKPHGLAWTGSAAQAVFVRADERHARLLRTRQGKDASVALTRCD
jgi:hypothetical protein